jgi:hypothetical protein
MGGMGDPEASGGFQSMVPAGFHPFQTILNHFKPFISPFYLPTTILYG